MRGDVDRIEAVEHQVRQLTSRLAGWVEAQMVQALEDRRNEMKALRAELHAVLQEQLAGMRAESSSVLSVATRRLEVAQEQLAERLDSVAERAAETAARSIYLSTTSTIDGERLEIVQQQVAQRLASVQEQAKAELAAAGQRHRNEIEALRAEMLSALKADADAGPARVEAFEQRVKAAMTRLTDSVETRLKDTLMARDAGLDALRTELGDRLERVRLEAVKANDAVAETTLAVRAGGDRTEVLEEQTKAAVARLEETIDTRLGELATARAAEVEGLRGEIATVAVSLGERLDAAALRATAVADRVTELGAASDASVVRMEELEQRVKAAVGRLAESVEERLSEQAIAQQTRFAQVHERIQVEEQRHEEAQERLDEELEAKLGEVVERRRAEFDSVKEQLEDALERQMKGARTEIATAVADAHRRFVVSVDQLHERMNVVADQAIAAHAAATQIETLQETVTSDGRRIEALEVHTRRTDARLGEVVQAKLSELATTRDAALEGIRAQMRAALDAHLAETRAEVTMALAEGRQQLTDGATRMEERQAALDRQADEAVAGLDALGASMEVAVRAAQDRLAGSVQAKLAELDAVAAQVAARRDEIDASMASVTRKVAAVVERMDTLAAKAAREAGALAPLRSDLRLLQVQVTELAATVGDTRSRRKAPAAPAKKVLAAPAKKVPVAPVKKAVAPAKKAAGAAKKASRARRVQ